MRWMLIAGLIGAITWASLPAEAGDADKETIKRLESELAKTFAEYDRLKLEGKHLREAYQQLQENATRATRAVAALTNSLTAAREQIAAQRRAFTAASERADQSSTRAAIAEQALEKSKAHNEELTTALTLTKELLAHSKKAKAKEGEIDGLRERLKKLDEEIAKTRSESAKLKIENLTTELENTKLRHELALTTYDRLFAELGPSILTPLKRIEGEGSRSPDDLAALARRAADAIRADVAKKKAQAK